MSKSKPAIVGALLSSGYCIGGRFHSGNTSFFLPSMIPVFHGIAQTSLCVKSLESSPASTLPWPSPRSSSLRPGTSIKHQYLVLSSEANLLSSCIWGSMRLSYLSAGSIVLDCKLRDQRKYFRTSLVGIGTCRMTEDLSFAFCSRGSSASSLGNFLTPSGGAEGNRKLRDLSALKRCSIQARVPRILDHCHNVYRSF